MASILEAVLGHQTRLATYQARQQRLHTERLHVVNVIFDALWVHKETLAECGIFEPLLGAASQLIDIAEEESEVLEIGMESAQISAEEMLEAVKT